MAPNTVDISSTQVDYDITPHTRQTHLWLLERGRQRLSETVKVLSHVWADSL